MLFWNSGLVLQTSYYKGWQKETMPLTSSPAGVESWLGPLPFPSPHALAWRRQTLAEHFPPLIMSSFFGVERTRAATVAKWLHFHWGCRPDYSALITEEFEYLICFNTSHSLLQFFSFILKFSNEIFPQNIKIKSLNDWVSHSFKKMALFLDMWAKEWINLLKKSLNQTIIVISLPQRIMGRNKLGNNKSVTVYRDLTMPISFYWKVDAVG